MRDRAETVRGAWCLVNGLGHQWFLPVLALRPQAGSSCRFQLARRPERGYFQPQAPFV